MQESLKEAHAALRAAREALVGMWDRKPGGGTSMDAASTHCVLRAQKAIRLIDEALEPLRPETVYDKSARWAWPDGRPDL